MCLYAGRHRAFPFWWPKLLKSAVIYFETE